jgi:DMSO/TMAO reductase YedYZ molybdopterin-dependent catalytic subunit
MGVGVLLLAGMAVWSTSGRKMKKKLVYLCLALMLTLAFTACGVSSPSTPSPTTTISVASPVPGEIEAREFMGKQLTPLKEQGNNALSGRQDIARATYRLKVTGLVDTPLELTYEDLLALPQVDNLMDLNCVEGWGFTAKWTGPAMKSIFERVGVKAEAKNVIFHTADVPRGYTSLLLDYILSKDIILGMKINDLTLPPDRGFPFQVVAESKFGYKWAKWVTDIELTDDPDFRGYWETAGYSNNADDMGPPFD